MLNNILNFPMMLSFVCLFFAFHVLLQSSRYEFLSKKSGSGYKVPVT